MAGDGTAILQSNHSHPASLNWFKLALLHQNEQPQGEVFREASRAWAHMAAKDMTCIFLRALLRQPLEELQSSRPFVDKSQMRFNVAFTFPASWGHDDCKRMKEAVQAIDIQALVPGSQISTSYLSEQEAAFLSLLGHPTVANFQVRHCSLEPSQLIRADPDTHLGKGTGRRLRHGRLDLGKLSHRLPFLTPTCPTLVVSDNPRVSLGYCVLCHVPLCQRAALGPRVWKGPFCGPWSHFPP
jgi:hypothetical protein